MKVKIKKLSSDAVLPRYMKADDSGMDLVATSMVFDKEGNITYGTSLAFEIPVGYVGLIFPRSSNASKDLVLSNSVGVIDPGYRGEVKLKFKPSGYFATREDSQESDSYEFICFGKESPEEEDECQVYAVGDRIGQIIIIPRPHIEWEEVFELTSTERGEGGYGSTNVTSTGTFEGPTKM